MRQTSFLYRVIYIFFLLIAAGCLPCTTQATLSKVVTAMGNYGQVNAPNKVAVGVDAAFAINNLQLQDKTSVTFEQITSDPPTLVQHVENAISNEVICVVGPGTDTDLNNLLASNTLKNQKVVFFVPYTQTSAVRQWNDQLYFTAPPPTAELLALFSYVVSIHRPAKVGFMYLAESGLGEESLALLNRQLTAQGLSHAQVFVQPVSQVNPDPAAMQQFFNSRPQVVFVFGTTGLATRSFFQQAVQSQALIDSESVLACPFALMDDLLRTYDALVKGNVEPLIAPSRILFSSPVPLVTDTRFPKSVAAFTSALESSPNKGRIKTTADKTLAFSGWVSSQVAFQAALRYAYGTRAQFAENIFQQNRYIIMDEIIVGDYGGPCSSNTADIGAACSCNQGGHAVYVSSVAVTNRNADIIPIPSGNFYYGLDKCTPDDILLSSIYTIGVDIGNIPTLAYVYTQLVGVAANVANLMHNKHKISIEGLAASSDNVQGAVDAVFGKAPPDVITGPMAMAVISTHSAMVLDPVYEYTPLISTNDHTIYTCPTLDQELYLLVKYIKTQTSSLTTVVVSRDVVSMDKPIERALGEVTEHFGVKLNSLSIVPSATFTSEYLVPDGVTLVTNAAPTAVESIVKHLEENPKAVVALSFTDITSMYDSFVTEFRALPTTSTAADRLIFATNLPPWMTDANTVLSPASHGWTFTNGFLASVQEPTLHTPGGMRGYLVSKFLEELSSDLNGITSQSLLSNLYRRRYITVDGVTLGPYSGACSERVQDDCGQNFGARDISVWGFSRCLDASKPALTEPETPWVPNRALPTVVEKGLEGWVTAVIVCLVVLLVIVFVVMGVLYYFYRGDSRDNRNAPKDSSIPVTIMFTDIESSTALWSHVPTEMSRAVTAHHSMIRDLIVKYKCYEVKTIGDAFMIVTHDAHAAVQLAHELQNAFMEYNWDTNKIDEVYCRMHNLAQRPSNVEYASRWSGLRIRVGIHTGMSDIRFDDVTKGYDYYGDTSNTAARTEALGCGGQIIATEFTWNALTQKQQDSFKVHPLGAQYLRGVATAINMYEVITVEQRCFPLPKTLPSDSKVSSKLPAGAANSDLALQQALCESPSRHHVHGTEEREPIIDEKKKRDANNILDAYLGPYPAKEKRKLLEGACKQFGIQIPDRRSYGTNEEHVDAMIKCVASRTAVIVDYRQRKDEQEAQDLRRHNKRHKDASGTGSNFLFPKHSSSSGDCNPFMSPTHSGKDQNGVMLVMNDGGVLDLSEAPRPRSRAGTVEESEGGIFSTFRSKMRGICGGGDDDDDDDGLVCSKHAVRPKFLNGSPTMAGESYVKCFEEGNGLLFRISSRSTKQMGYYNDTTDMLMYVDFSFGKKSVITAAPGVTMHVNDETGRYEGRLAVPPTSTALLVEGTVNGYKLKYTAKCVNN